MAKFDLDAFIDSRQKLTNKYPTVENRRGMQELHRYAFDESMKKAVATPVVAPAPVKEIKGDK